MPELNKPPPSGHVWSKAAEYCLHCGMTLVEFYSHFTAYGEVKPCVPHD